ncbi:hypothetical protein GTH52_15005 (plasmid) [Clostridium tyrobutyricum]|jgi:hypothetical protein|uniref:Uncharacterized protein n=1 Tax=Clostridium tyrobutyricum DIVETGP TaxID=1408889 RepID=W6N7D8_CLOTY|nr:hypothetical protein [Clostridium tyrobutyricum]AND86325.1 hypothetical protein CTK_P00270 [Clostridium tyrobutyricum]ANP70933.1 hypothetical protein BA182_14645 [Clostridium tyrobutyricum]MBV4432457.1 DUF3847 domain-containing protein [Clostridium tyrobutyricum]MBV4435691.1 DUF3847 domain-containing protein [Clostridium tyrobutyricum]QCH29055.1 hypothetical protein EZN00_02680 [Clostridium tyrobutyricum]
MNNIEKLDLKIRYLEDKKKALSKSVSYEERKKRTRRLIQTGALAEKYFNIEHLSIEDREAIFSMFAEYIKTNAPKKYALKK